jgi:hypothetical protein
VRASRVAAIGLLAACACGEEPAARGAAIPSAAPEPVAVAKKVAEDAPVIAADASPDGGSADRGGVLCVAPLDYSETPGKGAMSMEEFRESGEPSSTARNARAVVTVNGERQEITLKKGARFAGLPLHERVVVSLANPGQPPYFGKKISFEKEGASALCLYENAFYGTVQLSDVPRRPFCRKCMKGEGD